MVDLKIHVGSHLIETVAESVFRSHGYSYQHADVLLQVHPVGDKGSVVLMVFLLLKNAHQKVGQTNEGIWVLEDFAVCSIASNVSNCHAVDSHQVISLNEVTGLIHHDGNILLEEIHLSKQGSSAFVKNVVGLPEAF